MFPLSWAAADEIPKIPAILVNTFFKFHSIFQEIISRNIRKTCVLFNSHPEIVLILGKLKDSACPTKTIPL